MAFYTPAVYWFNDLLRHFPLKIMGPVDSVRYIVQNEVSLSRFGDGELNIIMGGSIHFQEYDANLKKRLTEILKMPEIQGFKIGIPICINTLKGLTPSSYEFWKMNMSTGRVHWHRLCRHKQFLDSLFSWTYNIESEKNRGRQVLSELTKLWEGKNVLLVCGGG